MSTKKISQETFDEVVKENIEEFDQTLEESLKEAINQFKKQGVDLSNIDTSGGIGRNEIFEAIAVLNFSVTIGEYTEKLRGLKLIGELCAKDHPFSKRNQNYLIAKGGVNSIHTMVDCAENKEVLSDALAILNELSKQNVEIRDFFEPGGSDRICSIMNSFSSEGSHVDILIGALSLARTVSKSEMNKNALMKNGVGNALAQLVPLHFEGRATDRLKILNEACLLIRGMCVHDDLRKDMSCAYDNGRFFLKQASLISSLVKLSFDFQQDPHLASSALSAIKNLITTEEAVQVVAQHGAMDLVTKVLSFSEAPVLLVRSALGVARNICADDLRKDKWVADGTLDLLVRELNTERFGGDSILMEHGLACLAAMSLRSPSNSQRIVETGVAVEMVLRAMRRFPQHGALLRQGCLTIRNIAARCPDLRNVLLDAGAENVLRDAGKVREVVDEAYAALRDLGCDVQYVTVTAQGGVQPAYEQFGARKPQFNPIYDEAGDIQQRVVNEAQPPLRSQYHTFQDDDDEEDGHAHHDNVHSEHCDHAADRDGTEHSIDHCHS